MIPITHASHLTGHSLPGEKRPGTWTVGSRVSATPKTGGTFSVCYEVSHSDGSKAFLKASDVSLITGSASSGGPTGLMRLFQASAEQLFERQILDLCIQYNMDRVVKTLDYGELDLVVNGVRDKVFYIIFEAAIGDVRSDAVSADLESPERVLRILHHIAVGMKQLHGKGIAHNDVKPSNVLVFDKGIQKLADLGRATAAGIVGPWDQLICAGDSTYAAPESWGYEYEPDTAGERIVFDVRSASDVYMLGSMIFFFLSGQSLTPHIQLLLRPEHKIENWTEDFAGVLPYIVDAHDNALRQLPDMIGKVWPERHHAMLLQLTPLIRGLTHPDPSRRGDPGNARAGLTRYDLSRVISRFDLMAQRAPKN